MYAGWSGAKVTLNLKANAQRKRLQFISALLPQVLVELMGNPRNSKEFVRVVTEPKSGIREVEEHYFSQLTKSEIRELYEKYRMDHELFGFTPDYYIAMGVDDDEEEESGGGTTE